MVLASAVVAGMEAAVRGLSQTLHPFAIVFWRELFSVALLLPLWAAAGRPALRRRRAPLHLARSVLNGLGILAWYYALRSTPLAEATAIAFAAVPIAAALGRPVLGERVSAGQWGAVVLGLAGVAAIVAPRLDSSGAGVGAAGLGALAALASAALFGASMLVAKLQARRDPSLLSALVLAMGMGALAFAAALPVWAWPTATDLAWLALFGCCNVAGQVLFLEAMRCADASLVVPLDLTRLVWALGFGLAVYGDWPPLSAFLGATLIALSALGAVLLARRSQAPRSA